MLLRLKHKLAASLWLVPLLWVLAGIGLSFATVAIDRAGDHDLVPESLTGTPSPRRRS